MEKKNNGLSTILTIVLVIIVIVRIIMILGRSSNGEMTAWDSSYLMWSIFFLLFLIGIFIWNRTKNKD